MLAIHILLFCFAAHSYAAVLRPELNFPANFSGWSSCSCTVPAGHSCYLLFRPMKDDLVGFLSPWQFEQLITPSNFVKSKQLLVFFHTEASGISFRHHFPLPSLSMFTSPYSLTLTNPFLLPPFCAFPPSNSERTWNLWSQNDVDILAGLGLYQIVSLVIN